MNMFDITAFDSRIAVEANPKILNCHSEPRFIGAKNPDASKFLDSSLRLDLKSNRDSVQNDMERDFLVSPDWSTTQRCRRLVEGVRSIFTRPLKVGAIALLLAFTISSTAQAQLFRSTSKVGTTAAQFLKIGVGARAIGMGSAQVAMQGDISAVYWNPAALSRMPFTSELTFNHVDWLADINYDFAAGVLHLEEFGTLGLSVISLSVPEDIVRTVDYPEGDGRTWDGSSLAIGLTYAKSLTDRFSIGFNAKFVRESVWSESASGFALDFGTLYNSEIPGLSLGASISNFGTRMKLSGRDLQFNNDPNSNEGSGPNQIPSEYTTESFDMPLSFRIGIAYELRVAEDFRATTAIDATHPNDNTEYVNSGIELAWRETLFARVGYKSLFLRDSEQGLTWGLGIHYTLDNSTTLKLDYGFAEFGRLKNVQYFSLGVGL